MSGKLINRDPESVIKVVLWIGFFVLYMSTRVNVHGTTEDAWMMANDFTYGSLTDWLHPHHLLYGFIAHYWWVFWSFLGATNSFEVFQSLNCVLGATNIVLCYKFARLLRLPKLISVFTVLLIGFSFSYWCLSSEIEVAQLSALTTLLFLIYGFRIWNRMVNFKDIAVISLLSVFAVASHIFNFGLIAIGLIFILLEPSFRLRSKPVYAGIYVLLTFVGIYAMYGIVSKLSGSSADAIEYLIGYYSETNDLTFHWEAPILLLIGMFRALFGVELFFRYPFFSRLAEHSFAAKDFADEIFLMRNLDPFLVSGLFLAMLIFLLLLFVATVYCFARYKHISHLDKDNIKILVSVVACILLPVIVSGPLLTGGIANNEHFITFWIISFLLIALVVNSSDILKGRLKSLLPLSVLLLAVTNGLGAINAMQSQDNDLTFHKLKPWLNVIGKNDYVETELIDREVAALSYLTGAHVVNNFYGTHSKKHKVEYSKIWNQTENGVDKVHFELQPAHQ